MALKYHKTAITTRRPQNPIFNEKLSISNASQGTIYPGAYLPIQTDDKFRTFNAAKTARPEFSVEQTEIGQGVSDGVKPGDMVRSQFFESGDKVYALVATGATYSPGKRLKGKEAAKFGELIKGTATAATGAEIAVVRSTLATAVSTVPDSKVLIEIL